MPKWVRSRERPFLFPCCSPALTKTLVSGTLLAHLLLSIHVTPTSSRSQHSSLPLTRPQPSPGLTKFVVAQASKFRPEPSWDLPIMDLIEAPGKMYDPKPEDLDSKNLLGLLGKDFDSQFMSQHRPSESVRFPNGTIAGFRKTKRGQTVPVGQMPKDIRKLRLKYLPLSNGGKLPLHLSKKMRRKFKQILWAYTNCPVVHRWKDLGVRFWPRWIREGFCDTSHSCSFPSGMSCKPNKSEHKTVLRWFCRDWHRLKKCKWISVRYPVVTECSCGC